MMFTTFLLALSLFISNAYGFAQTQIRQTSLTSVSAFKTLLHFTPSDKQAEIAALEEKLRQLKEETQNQPTDSVQSLGTQSMEEEDEMEWALKSQSSDSVMLSERWKESKSSSSSDGGLRNIAIGLGVAIFLAIFSQVPVGNEDLQKYQGKMGSASRIDLGDLNPDVRVQNWGDCVKGWVNKTWVMTKRAMPYGEWYYIEGERYGTDA